mgnify:CR=1 FL=1
MRKTAAVLASIFALLATAALGRSGEGGFEQARKECGSLEGFDAIKACVERVNGSDIVPASAQRADVQAWLESCQKSDSADYLRDCFRKLANLYQAQELARATTAKAVTDCAKEPDDKLRGCIDEMATIVAIPEEMAKSPPETLTRPKKSGWYTAPQSESKIDGTRRVLLLLMADEPIASSGGREVLPSIAIRCHENVTSVVVNAPGHFVSGGVPVTYRLDQDKPITQTWMPSTSRDSVGLWSGAQAIPFVKSLLGRQDLVMRYKPFRTSNIEFSFTVAGLDKVIEPVRTACKW